MAVIPSLPTRVLPMKHCRKAQKNALVLSKLSIVMATYRGGKATVELNQAQLDAHPDEIHPVVRTHRETGKKSLFVNPGFVVRILDMQHDESDQLLAELFDHQLKTEFRYRHTLEMGGLVCADSRATMHRATADYSEPRRMWRMIVGGTG